MKKVLFIGFGTIICLLMAYLLFRSNRATKERYTITAGKTTIIREIRSLQRLETAQFTIEKIIDAGTAGNRFQEVLFGDRVLLIAHGEVIAGFDLSILSEDAIQIRDEAITVTLPSPEILVTRLDNEKTRVYDRQLGLLTKGDKNLETQARKEAENIIRNAACDGNILKEASINGKKQLTTLLKTLQFSTVTIHHSEGKC